MPTYQPVAYYTNITNTSTNTTYNAYAYNWYGNGNQYRPMWSSTNTTTSWANDVVWQYWVDNGTGTFVTAPPLAPVVDPAAQQRHEQRQVASVRARALLEGFLSDEQKAELAQGYFHVVGSRGRRYRIRAYGQAGNVELLRPDGALQARLCAHPRDGLPDADAWLAQALELRSDEDNFLKIANVHAGCLPDDLYAVAA